MPHYATWTESAIAQLRALWEQGVTTAEIGRRLHVSKSAAIAKASRLGLAGRASPIMRDGGFAPARPPRLPKHAATLPPLSTPQPPSPRPVVIPAVVVVERAKPVVDQSPLPAAQRPISGGCCWPLWTDDTPRSERRNCEAPRAGLKSPYCPDHRRRALETRSGKPAAPAAACQPWM